MEPILNSQLPEFSVQAFHNGVADRGSFVPNE